MTAVSIWRSIQCFRIVILATRVLDGVSTLVYEHLMSVHHLFLLILTMFYFSEPQCRLDRLRKCRPTLVVYNKLSQRRSRGWLVRLQWGIFYSKSAFRTLPTFNHPILKHHQSRLSRILMLMYVMSIETLPSRANDMCFGLLFIDRYWYSRRTVNWQRISSELI